MVLYLKKKQPLNVASMEMNIFGKKGTLFFTVYVTNVEDRKLVMEKLLLLF